VLASWLGCGYPNITAHHIEDSSFVLADEGAAWYYRSMKLKKVQKLIVFVAVPIMLVVSALPLVAGGNEEMQHFGAFTTFDLTGKQIDQSIFAANTLTLVNVWATFCPPCLQEMPGLGELAREYQGKGVGIVGVVTDVYPNAAGSGMQNLALALQIVEQTKADYPHLLLSGDLQKTRLGNVQAVPETFFVDSQGRVVGQTHVGARSKSAWKSLIESYLAAMRT